MSTNDRQYERVPSKRLLNLRLKDGLILEGEVIDVSLNGLFLKFPAAGVDLNTPNEGDLGTFKMSGESWPMVDQSTPPIHFTVVRCFAAGLALELTENQGYFAVALARDEFKEFFGDDDY